MWMAFNMRTFGGYHDLYLLPGVLLFADVFQSFTDMALREYRMDPCYLTRFSALLELSAR